MTENQKAKAEKIFPNQLQSKFEPKANIQNINSNYMLQNLFNMIPKKKSLLITIYNKSLQNRINININDYKNYCEQYSSIELEITPARDKFGLFINTKDFKNFHVYFNYNGKEKKANYITKEDKVTKIKIVIDHPITSFNNLFYKCKAIESIIFKKFYRTNITYMSSMFAKCKSLKEITFSQFKTDKVTNMQYYKIHNYYTSLL